ncbi:MAG: 5'-nucleotidase C-terminal domain-containing protein [Ignavibacteriales bacterium]|nr:5'-nucleotidase C-terminal domain-containing protein [Ignavibacteriales bacterium]
MALRLLFLVLFITGLLCVSAPAQVDTLTVLHVNDTHSNLATLGPRCEDLSGTRGGIARAASLIGLQRATNPNTLLLHAGDLFVGDLFFNKYFGVPEFQLMQQLGFDAMAVGNHEFDLGPGALYASLEAAFGDSAGYPLLSANTLLPDSTVAPLRKYIQSFVVRQVGNVKVGIFGMTTPQTNLISQPAPAFIDTNIVQIAQANVDTLKALGCQVILCLSHMGVALDKLVATYVPGIHAVVGGHDHFLLDREIEVTNVAGENTWVVQAASYYLYLGKLRLIIDDTQVRLLGYEAIPIADPIPEEPSVQEVVTQLIQGIEAVYGPVYSQQVAFVEQQLEEVVLPDSLLTFGPRDTPMGNLLTDALRTATGAEIGIEANGSIAHPLYQGPIVGADLYRAVGYGLNADNGLNYRLATLEVSGMGLLQGLEFGLSEIEVGDDFMLQASGLSYIYNPNNPPFQRLLEVKVGDQPIDPSATYNVATTEYVALFLDLLQIPYQNLHVYPDTSEFQVLLAYTSAADTIRASVEGRIRAGTATVTTNVSLTGEGIPTAFELHQNYPNPFNPSTTIGFSVPVPGRVRLSVFTILGQQVAELVNEELSPGSYKIPWNANGLPSGVYFYKLHAGSEVATRKLLLMK